MVTKKQRGRDAAPCALYSALSLPIEEELQPCGQHEIVLHPRVEREVLAGPENILTLQLRLVHVVLEADAQSEIRCQRQSAAQRHRGAKIGQAGVLVDDVTRRERRAAPGDDGWANAEPEIERALLWKELYHQLGAAKPNVGVVAR